MAAGAVQINLSRDRLKHFLSGEALRRPRSGQVKGIPVLFQPNVSLGYQQVLWRSFIHVIFHLNLQGSLYWKHTPTKSFKEQKIFWVKYRIDPLAKAMWCSFIWWWVLVDNWQWFLWWSFRLPVIARSLLLWGIACRKKFFHSINILYHVYQLIL